MAEHIFQWYSTGNKILGQFLATARKRRKKDYVCCSITITKLFRIRKKALLSKGIFLNHIYLFECVGATPQLENCLLELVLSFHHVGPRDRTQLITSGPSGQLQVLASILGLTGCLFYDSLQKGMRTLWRLREEITVGPK